MIDTLILSGGGLNSICILPFLKQLINHNTIDLKKIKNIICVSGSAYFIIPFLLGISIDASIKLALDFNKDLININDLSFNTMMEDYGFFSNEFFLDYLTSILKGFNCDENITLKQLYDKTNINFVIKVSNITKNEIEYLNHKNNPDLQVKKAILMTTAIPILFKPIQHNDNYYVDGAYSGNFPIEYAKKHKYNNYIGINIINRSVNNIIDINSYISSLFNQPMSNTDIIKNNKKIFTIIFNESGATKLINDYSKESKIKIINYTHLETEKYITKYHSPK
jgi:predicted acylesterase/phospholipase RssA